MDNLSIVEELTSFATFSYQPTQAITAVTYLRETPGLRRLSSTKLEENSSDNQHDSYCLIVTFIKHMILWILHVANHFYHHVSSLLNTQFIYIGARNLRLSTTTLFSETGLGEFSPHKHHLTNTPFLSDRLSNI